MVMFWKGKRVLEWYQHALKENEEKMLGILGWVGSFEGTKAWFESTFLFWNDFPSHKIIRYHGKVATKQMEHD